LASPDGRKADEVRLKERMTRSCTNFGLMHLGEGDAKLAMQAFRQAMMRGGVSPRGLLLFCRAWMKSIRTRSKWSHG
jgi:hypothetical protein